MKNFVMFVGAVFVAIAGAGSTAADPAAGLWQTGVDRGTVAYVRIAPCGEAMCETIERSFNTVASTGRRNTLIFRKRWSVLNEVPYQDLLFG
jgi:uncharacterized protein (DUF2147 family)